MSSLRDVRLLVAKHLDLSPALKSGVLDLINIIDAELDLQGFSESDEILDALQRLDNLCTEMDEDEDSELDDDLVSLDDLLVQIDNSNEDDDDEYED